MRILLSCLQSLERHPIPAYDFWRPYFMRGCEEAGMECVEVPGVDWAEALVYPPGKQLEAWRARTWESVLEFVRRDHDRNPVKFFLGYLYPRQVDAAAIAELQRKGIPCVNFFCDNVREFPRVPIEYRSFALHWVPEFEALDMYRKAGLAHLHAPMPCWIPTNLRTVPQEETEPPTFIGSADPLRRELLGRALGAGGNFVVRGPGWAERPGPAGSLHFSRRTVSNHFSNQVALFREEGIHGLLCKLENRMNPLQAPPFPKSHVRPAIFGSEYFRVTREAELAIGVNRVPTARAPDRNPLSYSRLRDIEAPMLGACYLTEWTAGLGQLYDLGVEIESYRTPEELVFKILELKADRSRRELMRARAQRRALSYHSVAQSLKRICERLGLHENS